MDKKTKMADGCVPSWNIRTENNEFTINTVIFNSENINPEISDELKKRLSSMSRCVAKNLLWSEMNTMQSVIYKHHNQHRKERYLQGVKRIQKHLARLREMKLDSLLSSFAEKMPKKDSKSTAINSYPCVQAIEYVLFKFMGAAKLITQTIGHCKSTINYVGGQLSKGFFITFHIVLAASLSRIFVLLKDFLHNILECYQKLYPWLGLLQETLQGDRNMKSDIPPCLKTWIITSDLDNTLFETPKSKPESITPQTSVVLEKLFSFTPGSEQKLVATSLSDVSYTDDAQPPDQLGESFDTSLNSTGRMLDASEPVPCELFKDVSAYNTTMTLEGCGMKHKLQQNIELHPHKQLKLDQDVECETTCTERNGIPLAKGRSKTSYRMILYPNKKLRYSTPCGTFKIPCTRTKRIICNSRMFESKVKRRKLQDKGIVQQLKKGKTRHSRAYKIKRIFINASCSKSKLKRILQINEKKYQCTRWKRRISLIIGRRILSSTENLVQKTQNLSSLSNATTDGKENLNEDSSSCNVQQVKHNKDSKEQSSLCENLSTVSRKYSGGISSLEKLTADEGSLTSRKEESGKPSKRIVKESKSISFERNSSPLMKEVSDMKVHHQAKDDYVDDIFDMLGV